MIHTDIYPAFFADSLRSLGTVPPITDSYFKEMNDCSPVSITC